MRNISSQMECMAHLPLGEWQKAAEHKAYRCHTLIPILRRGLINPPSKPRLDRILRRLRK
jgi:hypothetical protein